MACGWSLLTVTASVVRPSPQPPTRAVPPRPSSAPGRLVACRGAQRVPPREGRWKRETLGEEAVGKVWVGCAGANTRTKADQYGNMQQLPA